MVRVVKNHDLRESERLVGVVEVHDELKYNSHVDVSMCRWSIDDD